MTDYSRLIESMQSDGPYSGWPWQDARKPVVRGWHRWNEPVVPRRDVWSYEPPYFWLGREAEALNG